MSRIHPNNFKTTLAANCSNVATSITLTDNLPTIGAGEWIVLTISDNTDFEILRIDSNSGAPTYAIISRALEGTSAQSWVTGQQVSIRITKGSVDDKQDILSGASLTSVTVTATDKVIIQDDSDSDNIKTVTAQSIADLSGGGATFGTFTPTAIGLTTPGTASYSLQRGVYCKMGTICFIEIALTFSSCTGTGDAAIGGLPFEGKAGSAIQCIPLLSAANWNNAGFGDFYRIEITDSSTDAAIRYQSGSSSEGGAIMDAAATFRLTGFYFVD